MAHVLVARQRRRPPYEDLRPRQRPARAAGRRHHDPRPEWGDREAVAAHAAARAALLGDDPEQARATAARIWDRTPSSAPPVHAANQLGMVFARLDCTPRWRERLGDLTVPTLVVHGRADLFFPVGNGEVLAALIPDARLLVLDGMATALPAAAADEVAAAMLALPDR
ncbi:alpha/beta fold hydrolase [Saccharothrix sp. Mg75]|uniref:alpha/beta fold hydrolase n=1 Tax=Saccharothrix sp. Mg75 TaxID=3445357 RepID=UPI003EEEDC12